MDVNLKLKNSSKAIPYGKTIILVSFFNIAIVFGIWFSFSVFFVEILREYKLSRAYTAGIYSVGNLIIAFNAPVVGIFVDRFGSRVVLTIGALILSAGLFLSSQITSIWQLYITYSLVTCFGISSNHFVPYSSILSNWFAERRGRVLGIAFSGIGFGMMIISPLVEYLISRFGWRNAYLVLSLILLAFTIPMSAFFQRNSPQDGEFLLKKRADDPSPQTTSILKGEGSAPNRDKTLSASIKRASFWHVFFVLLFCAMGMFTIIIHYVAYLTDIGFSRTFASSLFSILGLASIPAMIVVGELSDRYSREATFTAMIICLILSIVVLLSVRSTAQVWMVYLFPLLFGLGYGGISPHFPAISSDIFAGRSFGKIYGMHSLGFNIGTSFGPWFAGKLFDLRGSYIVPFAFCILALALSNFFAWKAAPTKHEMAAKAESL